jgi:hypothetical protein
LLYFVDMLFNICIFNHFFLCVHRMSILSYLSYCYLLETQRDTSGLTAENRELKLRLQSMEEQAKLRDGMFSLKIVQFFRYSLFDYLNN